MYPVSSKNNINNSLNGYVRDFSLSELIASEGQYEPKINRVKSHSVNDEAMEHMLECIPRTL